MNGVSRMRSAVALIALVVQLTALSGCDSGSGSDSGSAPEPPPVGVQGWSDDVRLTDDSGASLLSYNFASSIAVGADDAVHVVWYDSRDGESQIYYKQSLDGGDTWQDDIQLVADGTRREHPAIAASGSMVHVAWHEHRNAGIYVVTARSLDGGTTWEEPVTITDTAKSAHPSIAAAGDRVQLVHHENASGYTEIEHVMSADRGATWSAPTQISDSPYESWVGNVTTSGNEVIVSWVDYRDANEEEYTRRSGDGGVTWGAITRVSDDPADSWAPSVAMSGDATHHLWFDRRHAAYSDVEVEEVLDEAAALVGALVEAIPPRDPTIYYLYEFNPRLERKRLAIDAAAPTWVATGGDLNELEALLLEFERRYAAWTMGWEIYYRRLTYGAVVGPETRMTNASHLSMRPSVVAVGDLVDVVWFDGRDGSGTDESETEIYHLGSTDGGETWSADRRLTTALGTSKHASIAATVNAVHVVWFDERDGQSEIYYKRLSR